MDYEQDYERGFMEKCAEMGLDHEMVKEAVLSKIMGGAGRVLGMAGRGVKGGLGRAARWGGGKMLGARDPSKSLMGWAGQQIGKYGDDVVTRVGQRGRLAANAAKGNRFQAANMARYSKGQKALGMSDALVGGLGLGAGGLGVMSVRGGGQPQTPQYGMPMNQYGRPFDPMQANFNQQMVMPGADDGAPAPLPPMAMMNID